MKNILANGVLMLLLLCLSSCVEKTPFLDNQSLSHTGYETRSLVLDPAFIQGRKGQADIEEISYSNIAEEIILQGVFAMDPNYHRHVPQLLESADFLVADLPDHRLATFNQGIYSDKVLRLRDNSIIRVQHSYDPHQGLLIRIVHDGLITYIKPRI